MTAKISTLKQYHSLALEHGDFLYESIAQYCSEHQICCGQISAVGALQNVNLGYYDQTVHEYKTLQMQEAVEIVYCTGNISIKDNEIFVHLHIAAADKENKVLGGHLMPESKVFACEVQIAEFEGEPFIREYDKRTGLYIWKKS